MKQLILLVAILFVSVEVFPQFDILKKVKDKVEDKTNQKVDEAIDSTIDNATTNKKGKEQKSGENETTEQSKENVNGKNTSPEGEDLKSFSKFDFVPGEQVLFFEDFPRIM